MSAIIKVMAGRTLTVADANVVEVDFIPMLYKFWSSTGLLDFITNKVINWSLDLKLGIYGAYGL